MCIRDRPTKLQKAFTDQPTPTNQIQHNSPPTQTRTTRRPPSTRIHARREACPVAHALSGSLRSMATAILAQNRLGVDLGWCFEACFNFCVPVDGDGTTTLIPTQGYHVRRHPRRRRHTPARARGRAGHSVCGRADDSSFFAHAGSLDSSKKT